MFLPAVNQKEMLGAPRKCHPQLPLRSAHEACPVCAEPSRLGGRELVVDPEAFLLQTASGDVSAVWESIRVHTAPGRAKLATQGRRWPLKYPVLL